MLSSLSMASSPSPASGRPGGPGGPGPPPETLEAFEFSPCVLQAPADGKMPAMAVPGAGHGKLGMLCSLYMDPKTSKMSLGYDCCFFYHHMINPLYIIITQYQVLIFFLSPYFIINQCKTHHSNPFYPQFPMTSLVTSPIPRSYRSHLQRRPGRGHVQWRAATARGARIPIAGRQDQRDPAAAAQWWEGGKSTKVGGNGEDMIDVFVDVSLLFFPLM